MAGRSGLFIILILFIFTSSTRVLAAAACHPILWPADNVLNKPFMQIPQSTLESMQQSANKIIRNTGKASTKDADNAALLALTYYLTHQDKYLNKAKEILLDWSRVSQPTGHPMDETRLEGMIWAFDLISCQFSDEENASIRNWFNQIRIKKLLWKSRVMTATNNNLIHHYKMLLLLDKVLQRRADIQKDIENLDKYAKINLNIKTSVSSNSLERSALYYHNYVLQPWIEITLISGCCRQQVKKEFQLSNQILSDYNNAPAIVMYYTLDSTNPDEQLWTIQMNCAAE